MIGDKKKVAMLGYWSQEQANSADPTSQTDATAEPNDR